jgi:hypothetical protein
MLRKKKMKDDVEPEDDETTGSDGGGSSLLERVVAAGQEYGREIEEVATESLEALRQEREQLQKQIDPSLERVRESQAAIAAAYERYLQALSLSGWGTLPGSQEVLRQAYDQYAAACTAGMKTAEEADRQIGELLSRNRAAEEAMRETARQRFAKAFHTYTRAFGEAWTSVDSDTADPGVLMVAAQELHAVAAHAAISGGTP